MIQLTKNWYELLKDEFEKPYFKDLQTFLNKEFASQTIFPPTNKIFNALNLVKFEDVKVVIIGQDPYHEPGQAEGLAFSVPEGTKLPPSLANIYKELKDDLGIERTSGSLIDWAKQGVLLLNTCLTVRLGQANSHKDHGWEKFVTEIVKLINTKTSPVVFILWGGNARPFSTLVNTERHLVLTAAHPSPLSAYNGFFSCKHFSKTNKFLVEHNETPINF